MKLLKDREGIEEVELEETYEEEETREEDQVDSTNVINKVTWLGFVLNRDGHVAHTVEPMDMQLNTAHS
jgi:hypothetical protein